MTFYIYVFEPVMIDLSMYMKIARACVWCDLEQQKWAQIAQKSLRILLWSSTIIMIIIKRMIIFYIAI